ncbi:MAG: NosD domain-containing protein [Promethearchaeota archaeon]
MNKNNLLKVFSLALCISFVITGVSLLVAIPENKYHEENLEPIRDSEFSECIVEGVGMYFEINNCTYLNITLASSEPIYIRLEVIPRMVSFIIKPNNSATSTVLTFIGFEPNFEYYLYQDGNLMEELTTDSSGSYSYQQDLTEDHHIYIQEEETTIYINEDGSVTATGADNKYLQYIKRTGSSIRYTYTLSENIYTTIVINRDNIILDGNGYALFGSGSGYGVYLNHRNRVTIKNLIVRRFSTGFYLYSSSSNTLTSNTATDIVSYGLQLYSGSGNTLLENTANYNGVGFSLSSSSSNTLIDNTATENSIGGFWVGSGSGNTLLGNIANYNEDGFSIAVSSDNTLMGNTATNNIFYGFSVSSCSGNSFIDNIANYNEDGFKIGGGFSTTLTGNLATNNRHYGFYLNVGGDNILKDNIAIYNNAYGFYLSSTSSNTLIDNIANYNAIGIYLYSSSNNALTESKANYNSVGFRIDHGLNNVLTGNTATNNDNHGFYLFSSSENTLMGNTVTNNNEYGFYLNKGSLNIIIDNTATENLYGFQLYSCSGNTLTGNTANYNYYDGFSLSSSSGNTLTGNTADNNNVGFNLPSSSDNILTGNIATKNRYVGFYLPNYLTKDNIFRDNFAIENGYGLRLLSSFGNLIFHNNFIDNLVQVDDTHPTYNYWHHPDLLEGNYWSDYSGIDNGIGTGKHAIAGDGIGDTNIPWPSIGYDFYPFTQNTFMDTPFTKICLFGDLGNDGWFTSDVLVILTPIFTGEVTTLYSFDSSTWYVYTDAFFIRDEGITTLYYKSIGNCNMEEASSKIIKIDKTPPETEIFLDGYLVNNEYFMTDVEVTLLAVDSISGVHHIEYYYGDSAWMVYTGPFTITEHGITTIYYRAVDGAGNVEDTKTEIVNIDKSNCLLWFNEIITDKLVLEDLCIRVYGNLEIAETGKLHLINCTIRINNGTNPVEYGIDVYGEFYVSENTKFTAFDPANPYFFIVHEDAFFSMNDSTVEFCGYDTAPFSYLRALTLWSADNCWIENNKFTNCSTGLFILVCENTTILNNIFVNNTNSGISVSVSDNTIIRRNLIRDNSYYGIATGGGWFNIIENNTIINNYIGVSFKDVNSTFSNNQMINNTYMAIRIEAAFNSTFSCNLASDITGVAIASFYMVHSQDTVFINNTVLYPKGSGFVCWYSKDCVFINNTAIHNNYGFNVHQSSGSYLRNNIAIGGGEGFSLFKSPNTCLIGNIALNGTSYGFQVRIDSHNSTLIHNQVINFITGFNIVENLEGIELINNSVVNTIHTNSYGYKINHVTHSNINGNQVEGCDTGFFIGYVYNCTIENNYANGNTLYGIRMISILDNQICHNVVNGSTYGFYLWKAENNTITLNNITNNEYGIYFDNPLGDSLDNIIYHNNFINNIVQAYDDIPENSFWYNPDTNEGNYWSDYPGFDDGSGTGIAGDGIGDTDLPWYYDPYPFINENGWI